MRSLDALEARDHVNVRKESTFFSALEHLSSNACRVDPAVSSIILSPVKYDGDLIGIFAFLMGAEVPAFSTSARGLITRALENFARPARYLYQRRAAKLIVDPIFKSRDTRPVGGSCFVMMPFKEPWSDTVFSTVSGILGEEGFTAIRADDLFGSAVVEDIWATLLKSEIVIADVTARNPNVYYELGIAHTLGKKVVILSQDVDDIPFDTRHLRHVIYSNSLAGFDALKKGIRGFLSTR